MAVDYREIGRNIRICRIRRGLKQKDLAERIHVTAQHISHIETGHSKLSLPVLIDIANVLETDLNELLGTNITAGRGKILDTLIAAELSGTPNALRERVLAFCREEVRFYKEISGLSD